MNCVRALWVAIHPMERGLQSKLREFMKRSFNSWRSQFMEEAQADENSSQASLREGGGPLAVEGAWRAVLSMNTLRLHTQSFSTLV